MAGFEQRLELFSAPQDPTEAKKIAQQLTMQAGSKGFEIVQALSLGTNLLLVMQKPIP